MVLATGLEPVSFCLKGSGSTLSYDSKMAQQAGLEPALCELTARGFAFKLPLNGQEGRTRTCVNRFPKPADDLYPTP